MCAGKSTTSRFRTEALGMRIALLVFVMLLMSSCSSNTNNSPRGMTPFFAECEGEGGTYTDKVYAKRKQSPCHGGWRFYDRGEPPLTTD
jgi:hypothetical protein